MCVHCSATCCFKPVRIVLFVIEEQDVSFKSIFFSLKLLLASLEIISESSEKCDCLTHSTIHSTVDVSFFCIIDNLGDIYATMKRKSSG